MPFLSSLLAATLLGYQVPQIPKATRPVVADFVQRVTDKEGNVTVQTGAHRLSSPGKPDVWLVGAVHVGAEEYYKGIQTLLNNQDVVLYEGVRPSKDSPKPPIASATAKPQETIYTVLGDALGLVFQNQVVSYKNPNWINSDLSWDEMEAVNKTQPTGSNALGQVQQLMDPNSPTTKMFISLMKSPMPGFKEALKVFFVNKLGSPAGSVLDPSFNEVIIEARNRAALAVFDSVLKRPKAPKSIAILYGAAHHPSFERDLAAKYGYKVVEKRWFSAASVNPSKLDENGKGLLKMLEGAGGKK